MCYKVSVAIYSVIFKEKSKWPSIANWSKIN